MRISRFALISGALAAALCLPLASTSFGQIQSTTTCQSGRGLVDMLSVMMMDPGLAANYHMEGIKNGLPSAYVYTMWDPDKSKVYYVKNPQGNPWDVNLYDSNYIYQWVTEVGTVNGVNHWNDPTSCRKFNNGSQNAAADLSMRWAARCAAPAGVHGLFLNSPPTAQPNNTNYLTYVEGVLQEKPQNLNYSRLKLVYTDTMEISDHRANPPRKFSITILPLQYSYTCSVLGNARSCKSREVFDYGMDTDVNPVDHVKHSYGWVRWRFYINSTGGNPDLPSVWVLQDTTTADQLMLGQVGVNFKCF